MDPHLTRLDQEIRSRIARLSAEGLCWKPPGKWSAAEILEHLYLTYTGTTKGFSRLLPSAPRLKRPTVGQRVATFVVLELGYFPTGRESPAVARPRGLPTATVSLEISSKIAEMDSTMAACEQAFGPNTKVLAHPFLGAFSVTQWRKFHLRHGLHHLRQVDRLIRSMEK